jgi:hypothetical protein
MVAQRTMQFPAPRRLRRNGSGGAVHPARGFILGYILFSLILLGIVVAAIGRMRDDQAGAEWVDRAQATLRSNLQVIRSQVLLCAVTNSSDAAGLVRSMPLSVSASTGDLLGAVACPGSNQNLFDGSNTVFVPRPPEGFTPWRYVNDPQGNGSPATRGMIFVYTTTADLNGIAAVNRLSRSFGQAEMTVAAAAGTTTLTYFLVRPPAPANPAPANPAPVTP